MIKSLNKVDENMSMFVLCMDAMSKEIMARYDLPNTILIDLDSFEDEELLSVKKDRSKGEYCWTCTAKLIHYVIKRFDSSPCTYVDADLFFYTNPKVIIDEMADKTVSLVPHRFSRTLIGKNQEKKYGKNCVQFNTFTSEQSSLQLLEEWTNECVKECSVSRGGDQVYTNKWDKHHFVSISKIGGAGVAPWNINRFKLIDQERNILYDKNDKEKYKLIFYHFQNVKYINRYKIQIELKTQYWALDDKLINHLYYPYLILLEREKQILENKFHFVPEIRTYIADFNSKIGLFNRISGIFSKSPLVTILNIDSYLKRKLRQKSTFYYIDEHEMKAEESKL